MTATVPAHVSMTVADRTGIVIPVRGEPADQVHDLVVRILQLLPGVAVAIVDDSDWEYWVDFELSLKRRLGDLPVTLIHRRSGEGRWGRLAGAVVDGFKLWFDDSQRDYAVCLDGDGQHDEAAIPEMLGKLHRGEADIVIGSRYSQGGSPGRGLSRARLAISKGCHLAARIMFPIRTRGCHDTMSGFFAVRLDQLDLHYVWVERFKVQFQLFVQHPWLTVAEVGYTFKLRRAGESNAGIDEGLAFAWCLIKLRYLALFPQVTTDPSLRSTL